MEHMSEAAVFHWHLEDMGVWRCDLPGLRLQVNDEEDEDEEDEEPEAPSDPYNHPHSRMLIADTTEDPTWKPWTWRLFRVWGGGVETLEEWGRATTSERAMMEAEYAAGRWL